MKSISRLPRLIFLNLDLVPQVDAADGRRGDLDLAEAPVEQLRPLGQGQVGGLLQGRWCNQVPYMLLRELRPPQRVDLKSVAVRAHAQPDQLHDGGDGPPEHPRNDLVVEDGPGEVGVLAGAEAEQGDVA